MMLWPLAATNYKFELLLYFPDSKFSIYPLITNSVFLSARWQYLLMLNYEVPAAILKPFIPPHVELDLWQGKAVVSMVGFQFNDTKVFGVKWPLHTHFDEINLRLYVKHYDGKQWKRGVAFVSEIVPQPIIAYMANTLYNEHYKAMPVKHQLTQTNEEINIQYQWKYRRHWNSLQATAAITPAAIITGSEEQFILEHYWGYNELNAKTTIEYGIEHPTWETYAIKDYKADFDIAALYGKAFVPYLSVAPQSVVLAKGSEVMIRRPKKIFESNVPL